MKTILTVSTTRHGLFMSFVTEEVKETFDVSHAIGTVPVNNNLLYAYAYDIQRAKKAAIS